ncbi:hypothetical protein [Nocardioides sp. GXZ039]|uniref:hypothetical protein n=1 Tax=Nocardioides sp. GXZ039 TaxID=3136018 RepID=UPI0030F3F521
MTTSPMTHSLAPLGSGRPIEDAESSARTALAEVAHATVADLDAAACRMLLLRLTALAGQVAELELRVLRRAEQVRAGEERGAKSTATWLAVATRQSRRATHDKARLARGLAEFPAMREAMAEGRLLPRQAKVILESTADVVGSRSQLIGRLVAAADSKDDSELSVLARDLMATSATTSSRDESDNPLTLAPPIGPGPLEITREATWSEQGRAPDLTRSVSSDPTDDPADSPTDIATGHETADAHGPATVHDAEHERPAITADDPPDAEPADATAPDRCSKSRLHALVARVDALRRWWTGRRFPCHRERSDIPDTRPVTGVRAAHGAFGWHVHLGITCPHEGGTDGRHRR